ncbi:hypothetical protein Tco_0814610 [Tanacetum coccineum]
MVNKEINKIAKMTIPVYVAEGKRLERQKTQANVTTMIAEAIQKEHDNLRAEVILQVNDAITNQIPSQADSFLRDYMSNNILHVHPTQTTKVNAQDLQYQLYLMMRDDEQLRNADLAIWLSLKISLRRSQLPQLVDLLPFAQEIMTIIKTMMLVLRGRIVQRGRIRTQEQLNKFDAWMKDVGIDDDEVPDDKVSQELLEQMSREIDEAQLQKVNYLKSDIIWESRKERLTLPTPKKKASVIHSCQRDPKAPPMTLLNQDLFYLKHGNSGSNKYILSLHKYPAAKQDHIIRQKQLRDNPHEVYSESKIVEIIKTTYELGHEHKFITNIIMRIANGKIDPITELDYKYLNKNDIEDMYLLCINNKVKDYRETELLGSLVVFIRASVIWERAYDFQLGIESYQQKVNLTAPTITFPGIEKEERFTITSEPVVGMIL